VVEREGGEHSGGLDDYLDPQLKDWERAYYGSNYKRLQQIKSHYDPDFRFRFPQAIRPA
jgi:FAD/FMN-containing dehydrogenase